MDTLPDCLQYKILSYNNCCPQTNNNYYLVCRNWFRYLLMEEIPKCQIVKIFGLPVCYYHHRLPLTRLISNASLSLF